MIAKVKPKIKDYLTNFLLVVSSIFLSLIVAEGICRIILDPVDYLKPYKVSDDILGHRLEPNSGGHDSWGYRNKFIPTTSDIVTIGDSQTYGLNATVNNSWPAVLQRLTGRSVYNLSLGGYSPVEYSYLLENKAFKLNPSLVIVGFYFGNDLREAYGIAYKKDYWKHLRRPDFIPKKNTKGTETNPQPVNSDYRGLYRTLIYTNWFAHHSILYRLVNNSSIGETFRFTEVKYGYAHENITIFEDIEYNIRTAFNPSLRLSALDLNDSKVQEGLRISLQSFYQMNKLSKKEDTNFLVVLIPTKESVFAPYIENNRILPHSQIIDELIMNERRVNKLIKAGFEEQSIAYVDVLDPLRNAVGKEEIYPTNNNDHPNKNGYRIIAQTVQQYLELVP